MSVLKCDMERDCAELVTHIDCKGFVYCVKHGARRRAYMRCRALTSGERRDLEAGLTIRY